MGPSHARLTPDAGEGRAGGELELWPLNRVPAGTTVVVKRLAAAPEVNQRLREMGFCEEQAIRVITLQENMLCQVCNSRLGLSSKLAAMIWVEVRSAGRLGGPSGVGPGRSASAGGRGDETPEARRDRGSGTRAGRRFFHALLEGMAGVR